MIAFSGIDCSGKSTQLEIIKNELDKRGIKNRVIWSRGGYTSWVEGIKTLLRKDVNYSEEQKGEYRDSFNKSTKKQKLLLWASIADLIRYYGIVFRFIELRGTLILCDRYIWDTCIDFKIKYPDINFEKWVIWKVMLKLIKKPAKSIIFVIPAEESSRRSKLKNDIHEEPIEVINKRIGCYMEEISKNRWDCVIDAMKPIEEIKREILPIIGI